MEEPDQQQPKPPKKGAFGRHRDLLAALVSGFVGAVALAASTYNVYLQREQVKAQVWPNLVLGGEYGKEGGFSIHVINRGVGPAAVRRFRVAVDGKRVDDWIAAEAALLRTTHIDDLWEIAPMENEVMSPGLEITAMRSHKHGRELLRERRRLGIELCYCSTLGECWLLTSTNPFAASTTAPIAECTADASPFRSAGDSLLDDINASDEAASADDGGSGKPKTAPPPQ